MSKARSPLGSADSRPRIHIWRGGFGPRWSIGPSSVRVPAKSVGEAVEMAMERVGGGPAVIIVEPQGQG